MKHHLRHAILPYLPCRSRPEFCFVDVVELDGRCYLIFTEPQPCRGRSLTNGIEEAIKEYHHRADLYNWPEPSELIYVENAPDGDATWSFVSLRDRDDCPSWTRVPDCLAWKFTDAVYAGERMEVKE